MGQTDPSTTIDNTNQSSRFIVPEAQSRQAQGEILDPFVKWYISPEQFLETQTTIQKTYRKTFCSLYTQQRFGLSPCEDDEFENNINFTTVPCIGTYNAFSSVTRTVYDFDDRWRFLYLGPNTPCYKSFLRRMILKGVQTDILAWDKCSVCQ